MDGGREYSKATMCPQIRESNPYSELTMRNDAQKSLGVQGARSPSIPFARGDFDFRWFLSAPVVCSFPWLICLTFFRPQKKQWLHMPALRAQAPAALSTSRCTTTKSAVSESDSG